MQGCRILWRRRGFAVLSILVLIATAATACTAAAGSSNTGGPPRYGGNLTVANALDIPTLDKDKAVVSNQALRVVENIFDRLYVLDRTGKPVPSLATRCANSADHLIWTCTLRKNAEFSNGKPITAADVRFSLLIEKKGVYMGSLYSLISTVEAPDPHTVVIKTTSPDPAMLAKLTMFASGVVPVNFNGEKQSDFWKKPVSSGPFVVQSYKTGAGLTLVPNTHYWGRRPYLSSITFKPVSDANTRILQLRNQQAQIVEHPSDAQLLTLQRSAGLRVDRFPSTEVDYFSLNTTRKPFNNIHVRHAISLAIDRNSIVKAAVMGNGSPAGAFMAPPILDGHLPAQGTEFNLAKARAELAKSPVPKGFHATLLYQGNNSPAWGIAAQVVQADLAKIGIKLDIKNADSNTISDAEEHKSFDMLMNLLTYDIPDPSELVDYYFSSEDYHSYFPATTMKKLNQQAYSTFDTKKRMAIYQKVADQVAADGAIVSMYTVPWTYATSKRLHGFSVVNTGQYSMSDLWLSK
ncbi:MAG TPA: ABC transporter substrate-binding protein [Mycobacteriales bacterium]|jgi:peptide/nickel transport system substrate-binding protein|nr:ABC transporter substrate-binding protein [Mycobacteriales bacterium]